MIVNEFIDPDPFQIKYFPSIYAAKVAISENLGFPLGRLGSEDIAAIDNILAQTMEKKPIMEKIKAYFKHNRPVRAIKGGKADDS